MKLQVELHALKLQINPHFLFNTLNNIYSLILIKSDKAPEAIIKLSSIMRYMVYETTQNLVKLSDEIDCVKSYIELEKLRFTDNVIFNFLIEGTTENLKIPPLIFLPFIENAFKFGISNSEPSKISIKICAKDKKISLDVFNTKVSSIKSFHKGFGLENIKNRLQLIYQNNYKLIVTENDKNYNIQLELKLND